MKGPILRTAGVLGVTAALTLAVLAPASADSAKIRDSGGSGDLNIKSAKIVHKSKKVVVSTQVTKLVKGKNQGIAFHLKTTPKKRHYGVLIVLRKKPAAQLLRIKPGGNTAVKCKGLKADASFKTGRAKAIVPRSCIGKPRTVRLAVETGKVGDRQVDTTAYTKAVKRG